MSEVLGDYTGARLVFLSDVVVPGGGWGVRGFGGEVVDAGCC